MNKFHCYNCGWTGKENQLHIGYDQEFNEIDVCPDCEDYLYLDKKENGGQNIA